MPSKHRILSRGSAKILWIFLTAGHLVYLRRLPDCRAKNFHPKRYKNYPGCHFCFVFQKVFEPYKILHPRHACALYPLPGYSCLQQGSRLWIVHFYCYYYKHFLGLHIKTVVNNCLCKLIDYIWLTHICYFLYTIGEVIEQKDIFFHVPHGRLKVQYQNLLEPIRTY